MLQRECRRFTVLPESGRPWCISQIVSGILTDCPEGCEYNRPVKWGVKTITTRFGKTVKIKYKIEEE